ncbi:hypothetical protein [Nocardioides oceani]|uniref:hypothetical protein n=1 Tax=Nocardioides oceani TaxID=3058369 RepID=UPI00261E2D35|nr:hypothetical protein [Nocardioides oceani]
MRTSAATALLCSSLVLGCSAGGAPEAEPVPAVGGTGPGHVVPPVDLGVARGEDTLTTPVRLLGCPPLGGRCSSTTGATPDR